MPPLEHAGRRVRPLIGELRALGVAALDLLFPALCPVCGATLAAGRRDPLCGPCWSAIPRLPAPWCARCGRPLPALHAPPPAAGPGAGDLRWPLCGACVGSSSAYDWARAAAAYDGVARDAIHAFKFRGMTALARPLAALVVEQCAPAVPADVAGLVPVPLARARQTERGFNQAALLAVRIAGALDVRVRRRWLARTRATRPQTELGAAERRANVRGAFVASPAVAGRHVVLVDDVVTTGTTVEECARALHAAGAARVGVLTVARVL